MVNRKRCPFSEGIDLTQNPPTGYPGVDSRLLQIRNRLRTLPLVSQADRDNVLTVLIPLCQLAARTLQDALFESVTSEPVFQDEIRNELRRSQLIGAELENHPHAGGGITDLSFRGIRIELKFEDAKVLTLTDCQKFTCRANGIEPHAYLTHLYTELPKDPRPRPLSTSKRSCRGTSSRY